MGLHVSSLPVYRKRTVVKPNPIGVRASVSKLGIATLACARRENMLTNRREIQIEWGDCDPFGIVFFPRYFEYFDACTNALFHRALGIPKAEMLRAVRDCRDSAGTGKLQFSRAVVIWGCGDCGIVRDEMGQKQFYGAAQVISRGNARGRRVWRSACGQCECRGIHESKEPSYSEGSNREIRVER